MIDASVPGCMQVLLLACDELLLMPCFWSVRHLLVEQSDFWHVVEALSGLPLLETLSLYSTGHMHDWQRCCSEQTFLSRRTLLLVHSNIKRVTVTLAPSTHLADDQK